MNILTHTLNLGGKLIDLSCPLVMEIVNASPDSFYEHGLKAGPRGDIVDVGGCSTRPGAEAVSEDEEWRRIEPVLRVLRQWNPDLPLSVDTFRPEIARRCIREFEVEMINDVSGGCDEMYRVVAENHVPYVLTFNEPVDEDQNVTAAALRFFADRVQRLCDMGQRDIVLDPGFGFGKTLVQNYQLLGGMEQLQLLGRPVLVGVSRKSMIYKSLGCTPADALNGTTVLNTIALTRRASILRVHDVKEAREAVMLNRLATTAP